MVGVAAVSDARPDLGLTVEIRAPDGTQKRWASHLPAADRPTAITLTSARFEGFKSAGCVLPRRIDRDYVDLNLLDNFALIGADGTVAYDGRVTALPRSMSTGHQVAVQASGWMGHAKDRKMTALIIDRDMGNWNLAISSDRWQTRNGAGKNPAGTQEVRGEFASADPHRYLYQEVGGKLYQPETCAWYDCGAGNGIGRVECNYLTTVALGTVDTNWAAYIQECSSNDNDFASSSADLRPSAGGSYVSYTFPSGGRVGLVLWQYNASGAGADGTPYAVLWGRLIVVGNHGLTQFGANGTSDYGFAASDIIKYLVGRFCPKLDASGVQETTYPVAQAVWREPTYPYDAFLELNKYHLWNLAVWEDRKLEFSPVDLSDYDWQVRLSDPGVTVELQGDSTEDLANGIVVTYTNAASGSQDRLTPDDHIELRDDSPENPASRAGLRIWTEIQLSSPTVSSDAIQIGRLALAEFNSPKAPGTITLTGHIRDRAGHWQQGWKVRAGDTIAIVDHPSDRPRLIAEVSWNHDTKTLQLTVEGFPRRLDAILDRLGTALAGAGIT